MSIPPVAIVTGAGSGIGAATCELLSDLGYRLTLVGRNEPALEQTIERLAEAVVDPPETLIVPADLADPQQAATPIELTLERWGRVDALVNNAGALVNAPVEESDEDLVFRAFSVNTFGPLYLIARVLPAMIRHGGGCIVNVSSMAVVDPFPGLSIYAASKCALDSVTRSVHVEAGERGVRAFSVAPGAVETRMLRSLVTSDQLPSEQTLDPVEVAGEILACIDGRRDDRRGETILLPSP